MISNEQNNIAAYRLNKATETLAEAEFLFEHRYWNTTINKLYYSCFYAAGALLASIEVHPKTHSGTIQMFSLHFIKTGILDKDTNHLYNKLFDMRQKADYEDAIDLRRKRCRTSDRTYKKAAGGCKGYFREEVK